MPIYKVSILKEFIEESDNEANAELEAISDLQYIIDKNLHTPLTIMENLNVDSRPLTESEYKELGQKMKENHSE